MSIKIIKIKKKKGLATTSMNFQIINRKRFKYKTLIKCSKYYSLLMIENQIKKCRNGVNSNQNNRLIKMINFKAVKIIGHQI
jgi:hypothetical protein